MELDFKQIMAVLGIVLLAVVFYNPKIVEASGGIMAGNQTIGIVILAIAAAVFAFGTGIIK